MEFAERNTNWLTATKRNQTKRSGTAAHVCAD